jgi:hypothetical protein
MVEHNDASEDDVESVESVEKLDQVTFWTLTLSFLLKLVAFGITAFTLPFNEWITLEQHQLKDESIIEIIVSF